MALRAFTEHPASVGESWFEHWLQATRFGVRMILGGLACVLHGLFPFLFVKTGSRCIAELHECMVAKRDRRAAADVRTVHTRPSTT